MEASIRDAKSRRFLGVEKVFLDEGKRFLVVVTLLGDSGWLLIEFNESESSSASRVRWKIFRDPLRLLISQPLLSTRSTIPRGHLDRRRKWNPRWNAFRPEIQPCISTHSRRRDHSHGNATARDYGPSSAIRPETTTPFSAVVRS